MVTRLNDIELEIEIDALDALDRAREEIAVGQDVLVDPDDSDEEDCAGTGFGN
jgi:hypothetical protein